LSYKIFSGDPMYLPKRIQLYTLCILPTVSMQAMEQVNNNTLAKMSISFLTHPHNKSIYDIENSNNTTVEALHQQSRNIIKQESQKNFREMDKTAFNMGRKNVWYAPSADQLDTNQLQLVNLHTKWIESEAEKYNDREALLENIKDFCKGNPETLLEYINNSAIEEGKVPLSDNPTLAEISDYIPNHIKELFKKISKRYSPSYLSNNVTRFEMNHNAHTQQRYAAQLEKEMGPKGIKKNKKH
jgi:hypothetical protein